MWKVLAEEGPGYGKEATGGDGSFTWDNELIQSKHQSCAGHHACLHFCLAWGQKGEGTSQ